jgi:aspartate carbamoyltransferase catalytic subunit
MTLAASAATAWRHRHLLDVAGLTADEVGLVLRRARRLADVVAGEVERPATLRGVGVANLFYEASTRTRVSFEVAARLLGADVVNVTAAASSVTKGESLVDTVRTLAALGSRLLVIRHAAAGAPYLAARAFGGAVVNAGDGRHAHPTQALLDIYTLWRHLAPDADPAGAFLAGRKVTIVGDVLHSRVARSNLWTLTAAGAEVWLCGPATLVAGFGAWAAAGVRGERPFRVTTDLDIALRDADAVMALRLQHERMTAGLLPPVAEYVTHYGLTVERLAAARPGAIVLHPGPMNEGVEIAPEVAGGPRSVVTEQVANGVAVRMAVLELLNAARVAG